MAALTSAISILEVVTAYFIDQKDGQEKATIQFGLVITLVGVFCSLSLGGGVNITSSLGPGFAKIFGSTFFDFLIIYHQNICYQLVVCLQHFLFLANGA